MSASANAYVLLITSEHRNLPKFSAWVAALVQPFVDQQNLLQTFPTIFDIDLAVGDQLDKLGAWIGASRNLNQTLLGTNVLPDSSYRILLKLLIAQNQWDGTIPGAYTLWDTIFAAEGYQIFIQDNQDMTIMVVFANPPTNLLILAVLTQGYFGLRSAGVGITGFFQPSEPYPATPLFGLDIESGVISGLDVGAWVEALAI